jgi:hypothetical protein
VPGEKERRHGRARAGGEAGREVDLAEQQDEDESHRDDRDAGRLLDQVADDIAILYLGQMVAQVDAATTNRERVVTAITTGKLNEGDAA